MPAGGGSEKIFTEIVAEQITVDVSTVGAPNGAAPARQPVAEPVATRVMPSGSRTAPREPSVPF